MVDARADAEVVTARILRETRLADEEAARLRAAETEQAAAETPQTEVGTRISVPVTRVPQESPEGYARTARLGTMAALTLLLVLLWMRHRRAG